MFFNDKLSPEAVPSRFVGAGAEELLATTYDFEDGPIREQDPTKGLMYQQWRAYWKDQKIYLEADNKPREVLIDNAANVTDISIAFSQNAYLHYAWVDNNKAYFNYYDTNEGDYKVLNLPSGTRTPKCTLDDKRPTQSGRNDVILAYINSDNKLIIRRQRDNFEDEIMVDSGPFISLERLYMSAGWRLQFLLVEGAP